jgi:mRNA interferase MazF
MPNYRLGSIWLIDQRSEQAPSFYGGVISDFEPQIGTEIKKTRPGLIISATSFNQQRQKITVLPLTSRDAPSKGSARVFVPKSNLNCLDRNSEIIAIDPATFDKQRFNRFIGELESDKLLQVQQKLRIYLSL